MSRFILYSGSGGEVEGVYDDWPPVNHIPAGGLIYEPGRQLWWRVQLDLIADVAVPKEMRAAALLRGNQ